MAGGTSEAAEAQAQQAERLPQRMMMGSFMPRLPSGDLKAEAPPHDCEVPHEHTERGDLLVGEHLFRTTPSGFLKAC